MDAPSGQRVDRHFGLRERKRIATRRRIILAARESCLARGLPATTIEVIARDADISPRSFFNYFSTKEAALLGLSLEPPHEVVDSGLENLPSDLASAVVHVVFLILGNGLDDVDPELRRRVLRRYPDLLDQAQGYWKDGLQAAAATITRLLELRGQAHQYAAEMSRPLLMLAATCLRDGFEQGDRLFVDEEDTAGRLRRVATLLGGRTGTC